jgi:hypothetical protein
MRISTALAAVLVLSAAAADTRDAKDPGAAAGAALPAFAPKKGQAAAAMFDDELACRAAARKETGFDPDAPVRKIVPPVSGRRAPRAGRMENARRDLQQGQDEKAFRKAYSACMSAKGYRPGP